MQIYQVIDSEKGIYYTLCFGGLKTPEAESKWPVKFRVMCKYIFNKGA